MHALSSLIALSDRDLLETVTRLGADERQATAALIASLAEMDVRRLSLGDGCSSLFTWCTQVLHLSEHAAYGRIEAARAARRFPLVLERLAAGEVTLTAVCLLRPHLTDGNHRELLDAVRHKSKRDVEHLVAALRPKPDVAPAVRKLPRPRPVAADSHGGRGEGALIGGEAGGTMPSGSGETPTTSAEQPVVQSTLLCEGERAPSKRRTVVAPLAARRRCCTSDRLLDGVSERFGIRAHAVVPRDDGDQRRCFAEQFGGREVDGVERADRFDRKGTADSVEHRSIDVEDEAAPLERSEGAEGGLLLFRCQWSTTHRHDRRR